MAKEISGGDSKATKNNEKGKMGGNNKTALQAAFAKGIEKKMWQEKESRNIHQKEGRR